MQRFNGQQEFESHNEARSFFEERYGERFVFEESLQIDGQFHYFYRLILDEPAYIKGASDLNSTGYIGLDFKNSYQSIRISEDGIIKIAQQ